MPRDASRCNPLQNQRVVLFLANTYLPPFVALRCLRVPLVACSLCNQCATKSSVSTCRREPIDFTGTTVDSRQEVRQLLDGAGQVVQPPVRVAGGQHRGGVPGQFL